MLLYINIKLHNYTTFAILVVRKCVKQVFNYNLI